MIGNKIWSLKNKRRDANGISDGKKIKLPFLLFDQSDHLRVLGSDAYHENISYNVVVNQE